MGRRIPILGDFHAVSMFAYEDVKLESNAALREVGECVVGSGEVTKWYPSIQERDMFLEFANAAQSKEAVLAFVKRFGIPSDFHSTADDHIGSAFPVKLFLSVAAEFRFSLDLYNAIQIEDCEYIDRNRELIADLIKAEFGTLQSSFDEDRESWFEHVHDVSRKHLLATASLYLHLTVLTAKGKIALLYVPGKGIDIVPGSMDFISTMYFQFAQNTKQGGDIGVCQECSDVFEKTRVDQRFCRKSCGSNSRMRKYRKRLRTKE